MKNRHPRYFAIESQSTDHILSKSLPKQNTYKTAYFLDLIGENH